MTNDTQKAVSEAQRTKHVPLPVYELDSYEPVEFTMPIVQVGEDQIDARIRDIVERMSADFVPTSRADLGEDDHCEIDLEVFDSSGKPIENLCSKNWLYSVGEGLMPSGFDEGIHGMKVGETRSFTFNAPDLNAADGVEGEYTAKVTLDTVMDRAMPEITDEWVARYMPIYPSAKAFRAYVRNELENEAQRMQESERLSYAASALAQRFNEKIDDIHYEKMRSDMLAGYEAQARSEGLDLDGWIEKQSLDKQQFTMMMMFQVRDMLKTGFSLDAWARHYGILPTEDDLEEFASMMSPQGKAADLLAHLEKNSSEKESFMLAARRYTANKDLAKKAIVHTA